ncbi:hypothetical protein V1277_001296 [Bradyrhizobium sp. AZCC 1588]|uniref:hypothetical protein n=1 Tax=unclassified Bradyrhizobium TaxID=2631580 RepID=UPI002FEF0B31
MNYLASLFAVAFPTQICPGLNGKFVAEKATAPPCDQEIVMSIEHSPRARQPGVDAFRDAGHRDNVVPLRQDKYEPQARNAPLRGDALLAALSPLLDEADGLRRDGARQQENGNLGLLLEENVRLRKLAVRLSNLLGDLPEQGK